MKSFARRQWATVEVYQKKEAGAGLQSPAAGLGRREAQWKTNSTNDHTNPGFKFESYLWSHFWIFGSIADWLHLFPTPSGRQRG